MLNMYINLFLSCMLIWYNVLSLVYALSKKAKKKKDELQLLTLLCTITYTFSFRKG